MNVFWIITFEVVKMLMVVVIFYWVYRENRWYSPIVLLGVYICMILNSLIDEVIIMPKLASILNLTSHQIQGLKELLTLKIWTMSWIVPTLYIVIVGGSFLINGFKKRQNQLLNDLQTEKQVKISLLDLKKFKETGEIDDVLVKSLVEILTKE